MNVAANLSASPAFDPGHGASLRGSLEGGYPLQGDPMLPLDDQQQAARDWFESLRGRICAAFEQIEREAGSDASFLFTPWDRTDHSGEPGGGGVRGQMVGKVFEKVGVNVSTVGGSFSPEFAKSIPGAEEDPNF